MFVLFSASSAALLFAPAGRKRTLLKDTNVQVICDEATIGILFALEAFFPSLSRLLKLNTFAIPVSDLIYVRRSPLASCLKCVNKSRAWWSKRAGRDCFIHETKPNEIVDRMKYFWNGFDEPFSLSISRRRGKCRVRSSVKGSRKIKLFSFLWNCLRKFFFCLC